MGDWGQESPSGDGESLKVTGSHVIYQGCRHRYMTIVTTLNECCMLRWSGNVQQTSGRDVFYLFIYLFYEFANILQMAHYRHMLTAGTIVTIVDCVG